MIVLANDEARTLKRGRISSVGGGGGEDIDKQSDGECVRLLRSRWSDSARSYYTGYVDVRERGTKFHPLLVTQKNLS